MKDDTVGTPGRAALLADLRHRVFAPAGGHGAPDRIGAEVEWIALRADDGFPVPLDAPDGLALLPALRRHARAAGWVEEPTPYGAPRFRVPSGGGFFFEPGGQVEFSTPPLPSATALLECIRRVLLPLVEVLRGEGIEPVFSGIDPVNPLERVPMQLGGVRYERMAAYLARRGPAGGRMMRQTAALQLNLDFGGEPALRWRVLNAAAPYLLAIFANSPRYAGRATGHRSFRAACWRELDPARTGLLPCAGDAAAEYLEFALGAPAMLKCPPPGEPHLPFGRWLERGEATLEEWRTHLTTLFPEVRPKGYLELRSLDALPPEGWPAPVALVGGLLYDRNALHAAADLLGAPDVGLLRRAGVRGVDDARIAGIAADLVEIGLAGAAALGRDFIDTPDLDAGRDYLLRLVTPSRASAGPSPMGAPA